jgi:uncharacterized protein
VLLSKSLTTCTPFEREHGWCSKQKVSLDDTSQGVNNFQAALATGGNMTHARPTQSNERLDIIDILRGFAIFGILVVNMLYFAQPIYLAVLDVSAWTNPVDGVAYWLIGFFAEAKFFTLFSLLFGLGLAIQLERAELKRINIVRLYLRRLLVLLVFGLIHAFLFWWGDILTYYALLGGLLLFFRATAPKRLLRWSITLVILPFLLNTTLVGLMTLGQSTPEGAAQMSVVVAETRAHFLAANERALEVYSSRSFLMMIPQRINDWGFATTGVLLNGMLFLVFAMFLLGLYVGKRRLLHNPSAHLPFFRHIVIWGGITGIIGNLLYVTLARSASPIEPNWGSLLGLFGYLVGAPALSMTYASGIVLLVQRSAWQTRLYPLAAVGRTALSNYLLQTLVCTTIFYGYGLGLYGQIGPALGLLLTCIIFAIQVPSSNWWLAHFHFGPAEWLWRSLTYGKWQPLRVRHRQAREQQL